MLRVFARLFLRCPICAWTKEACCQMWRQVYSFSTASFVLPKYRSGIIGILFLDNIKALQFVGSKVTFQFAAHTLIFSRSLFRLAKSLALSFTDLIGANSVESSAYRYSWFSQVSTRSSMKIENRRGPSGALWYRGINGWSIRWLARENDLDGPSMITALLPCEKHTWHSFWSQFGKKTVVPHSVKGTFDIASNYAYFFTSI